MTTYDPPPHLQMPVALLVSYLTRPAKLPFVATGDPGTGRGFAIDAVLTDHGFTPLWLDTPETAPTVDLDGHRLFPVYDVKKVTAEIPCPSVVLAPSDWKPDKELKGIESAYFPPPPYHVIEEFLSSRGYPTELANGNPTYASALMAMRAWKAAKVHVSAEPPRPTGWDAFRQGGPAPVADPLLGYYADQNLPREYRWWNRILWLKRHVPAWLSDKAMNEVRARWPAGKVEFPSLLVTAKAPRSGRREEQVETMEQPTVVDIPAKPKTYSIDWD